MELGDAKHARIALRTLSGLYRAEARSAQRQGDIEAAALWHERNSELNRGRLGEPGQARRSSKELAGLSWKQARIARERWDFSAAIRWLGRCVEMNRLLGTAELPHWVRTELPRMLIALGLKARESGWLEAAEGLFRLLLDHNRQVEDEKGALKTRVQLASLAKEYGRVDHAERLCHEILEDAERLEQWGSDGVSRGILADIYRARGDSSRGERLLMDHLQAARQRDEPTAIAAACARLAFHYQEVRKLERAVELREECLRINESYTKPVPHHVQKSRLQLEYLYGELESEAIERDDREAREVWHGRLKKLRERLLASD